jgi:hypothetical protein
LLVVVVVVETVMDQTAVKQVVVEEDHQEEMEKIQIIQLDLVAVEEELRVRVVPLLVLILGVLVVLLVEHFLAVEVVMH